MGENTTNSYFYKPALGASGAAEKALFDEKLDLADAHIPLSGLDADKPTDCTVGQIYVATDTDKIYKCISAGTWTLIKNLDLSGNNAADLADITSAGTDIEDAVTKRHTQNTDTDLDATFEATFAKKADKLNVFAATTSAELAGVISDETGTGKVVFGTSPTLETPNIANVVFPATQVASANANTLDDYEEGSWTPDLQFGGGKVDLTYTTQAGYYTKIGRQVTVTCYIVLSAKGTSTGNAKIEGLPFTSVGYSAVSMHLNGVTFADVFQAYLPDAATYVALQEITVAGVLSYLNDTNFADTSRVIFTTTYFMG